MGWDFQDLNRYEDMITIDHNVAVLKIPTRIELETR